MELRIPVRVPFAKLVFPYWFLYIGRIQASVLRASHTQAPEEYVRIGTHRTIQELKACPQNATRTIKNP